MKKVLLRRRKVKAKDMLRLIGLFVGHYASLYLYFGTIIFLYGMIYGEFVIKSDKEFSGIKGYSATVGPAINALIHLYYLEKGSNGMRLVCGLHTMFIIILFPLVQFL